MFIPHQQESLPSEIIRSKAACEILEVRSQELKYLAFITELSGYFHVDIKGYYFYENELNDLKNNRADLLRQKLEEVRSSLGTNKKAVINNDCFRSI